MRPNHRLTLLELRLVYLLISFLLALEWLSKLSEPGPVNWPKFFFTYPLCMGVVLLVFWPGDVNLPDLIILWASSLALTVSVNQLLPG